MVRGLTLLLLFQLCGEFISRMLDLPIPGAVGMFQIEPAVLLDVESFVFDFPAASAAAVGQSGDVVGADGEVGQPCEELLPESER